MKVPGTTRQPQVMQIRGVTIPLEGIPIDVLELESGDVALSLGPVAMTFIVPLTKEASEQIAHALGGGKTLIARTLALPTDGV